MYESESHCVRGGEPSNERVSVRETTSGGDNGLVTE